VYVSTSALCLVLASCGKDESTPHDISMPIDDFPASAELYLNDLQGTAVARVDAAGSVVADAATHAYGAVRYESGGVDPYGFVGNERDFGAGISDFQARPYRPELSRFLGVDPVPLLEPEAFSEGFRWQAYTYAAGDPVNGVDRDGRFVLTVQFTESASLGGIMSNGDGFFVAIDSDGIRVNGLGTREEGPGFGASAGLAVTVGISPFGNENDIEGHGWEVGGSAGPYGAALTTGTNGLFTAATGLSASYGASAGTPEAHVAVTTTTIRGPNAVQRAASRKAERVRARQEAYENSQIEWAMGTRHTAHADTAGNIRPAKFLDSEPNMSVSPPNDPWAQ